MKKLLCTLLALTLCLCLMACGSTVPVEDASDADKQLVLTAAKTCLGTDAFNGYLDQYAALTGEDRAVPEIVDAVLYHCDDIEGFPVDAVFFRVSANVAWSGVNGDAMHDTVLFAIDNTTGTVYDSITHENELVSFDGTITSAEDAILACMNSPVLFEGADDFIWGETETASRFSKSDIKELNAALNR